MSNRDLTGKLQATVEILQSLIHEEHKRREVDRRTMTALLHQVEHVITQLDDIPTAVDKLQQVLSGQQIGRWLKTAEMAELIGLHPDNLRRKAEAGEIPGYQSSTGKHWLFDPQEVKAAIRSNATVTQEAQERAAADPWARGAEDYDTYRERVTERSHAEQISKEMEQGL